MAEDIITGRIVFDAKGIRKAAKGLGGAPADVAARMPKTEKAIASTSLGIGKLAASFAAGMAIWEGIKSLMGKLVAASPQLVASIGILKKAFEFTLRPIGDAISGALRPFALAWLKFSLKWYKDVGPKMEKWFTAIISNTGEFVKTFFGEQGLLGGDLGVFLSNLFKDLIPAQFAETWDQLKETLGALWKFLTVDMLPVWQILGTLLGVVILFALKSLKFGLESLKIALEFLGPIISVVIGWLADKLAPAFEAIPGIIDDVFQALNKWRETIVNFFTKIIPEAWEALKVAVSKKMEEIKTTISEIWESIKTSVSTVIDDIATVVQTGWDLIKTIISNVVDGIITLLNTIPFVNIGNNTPGPVNEDFILRGNKVTRFSPQDNLIGFKGDIPPTGGMTTSIVVHINALDPSSIDDNVIRKITEAIDNAQRRGIMSRTMQAAGS